ncbi:FxsA family protein [Glycomyces luteolus]|uniref:FxsA family protein n=1 Tax=Glycomyces luteolus TaxID=2670330 RepID=A0A9X3PAS2_9ACTN|nr:FxsA family protein [Glycomyces luteolus]MDA1360227.1 FxsA family protein [Glycomyces luteolus]
MTYQPPAAPKRAPLAFRIALASWVIAEAAAFFGLAYLIGFLYTVLIFVGTSFLGIALVQYVGKKSFAAARDYLNSGGDPSRELPNGYALAGAVCLIVPGFVTDFVGLLLLFPPTRLLFRGLGRWLAASAPVMRFGGGDIIDGEVIDERSADGYGTGERGFDADEPVKYGDTKNGPRSIDPGP